MRAFLLALILALAPALAPASDIMSAEQAYAAAASGEVVLIDIRGPDEWAASGMPAGAVPLTMQDPEFAAKFGSLLERAGGRPLALICATGGRSGFLSARLKEVGVSNVIDVSEGVFGSAAGPGWLKRDLPVERPDAGTFTQRLEALAAD